MLPEGARVGDNVMPGRSAGSGWPVTMMMIMMMAHGNRTEAVSLENREEKMEPKEAQERAFEGESPRSIWHMN